MRLNTYSWGQGGGSPSVCVYAGTAVRAGGRPVAEPALRDPRLVDRLVLLEPVLHLAPRGRAGGGGAGAP